MALPTFAGFSLNDSNWITERITFKGYANRDAILAKVNRREGVKLLGTEFGEKEITLEGSVVAASVAELQTLLDNFKKAFTAEEGDLILESNRTFLATVKGLSIPDEHYNQSKAPFMVTFVCSNPFAEGALLTVTMPVTSGVFTFSGTVNVSGTLFARPTIVYTPGAPTTGHSLITKLDLYHVPTGQTLTVSGFGSGTDLGYQNTVTINLDDFTSKEGTTSVGSTGSFPRFEPGINNYTLTASGRFPGGSVSLSYKPRFL